MDTGRIFGGALFILIGLVMFYASVIEPRWSYAPKFTTFLSGLFVFMGICIFVKPEITIVIICVAMFLLILYGALEMFTAPFVYRKKAYGKFDKTKISPASHVHHCTHYDYVYMEYEYNGERYGGFSQNTVDDMEKRFEHGEEYKIYINPAKPDKFVTKKWAGFIGSCILMFFLLAMVIGAIVRFLG